MVTTAFLVMLSSALGAVVILVSALPSWVR